VFTQKHRGAIRIVAISRQAMAAGLKVGLTLADARARVPDLVALESDPTQDSALLEKAADFCDRYTPLVALDGDDGLVLDITGCAHLFGGEAALRDDLHERFSKAGLEMTSAIASTPDAARALARYGVGCIVETGRETASVASLPVACLGIAADTVLALNRSGLGTIADLASRPRTPLAARFGVDLLTRLARVLGEEDVAITARRPLPPCTAERRFAEPIALEADVLATLEHLMTQTAPMLERRGKGGRLFEASLFRTDGAVLRLSVETSLPTRKQAPIMRLFRERIDTLADPLDPGFGYDLVRFSVSNCAPMDQAQTSLDGHQQDDEEVAALIDQLSTRLGRDAVVRFAGAQTHIPERAAYMVPANDCPSMAAREATSMPDLQWNKPENGTPPTRPIHLFEHPQRIETVAEFPDGPPLRFRWRRVLHEIVRTQGPERIAPEWWHLDDTSLTRDYYRIEDSQGRRFWVFREGLFGQDAESPAWFVHGLFA
jgi:protein ImuB